MNSGSITDSELEVLWGNSEPIFFGELLKSFNEKTKKDWKKQTMNTFLFRMRQKNLVEDISSGRYKRYRPLITREEYVKEASRNFLDRNYGGSFAKMLTMLGGSIYTLLYILFNHILPCELPLRWRRIFLRANIALYLIPIPLLAAQIKKGFQYLLEKTDILADLQSVQRRENGRYKSGFHPVRLPPPLRLGSSIP